MQWNLRTRDTMGPKILSLVERSSLSRRWNKRRMGLKQVPFVERSSLSWMVPYQRFHCILVRKMAQFRWFRYTFFACQLLPSYPSSCFETVLSTLHSLPPYHSIFPSSYSSHSFTHPLTHSSGYWVVCSGPWGPSDGVERWVSDRHGTLTDEPSEGSGTSPGDLHQSVWTHTYIRRYPGCEWVQIPPRVALSFPWKRKSCPGCSWLVCFALPFYLATYVGVDTWTIVIARNIT